MEKIEPVKWRQDYKYKYNIMRDYVNYNYYDMDEIRESEKIQAYVKKHRREAYISYGKFFLQIEEFVNETLKDIEFIIKESKSDSYYSIKIPAVDGDEYKVPELTLKKLFTSHVTKTKRALIVRYILWSMGYRLSECPKCKKWGFVYIDKGGNKSSRNVDLDYDKMIYYREVLKKCYVCGYDATKRYKRKLEKA